MKHLTILVPDGQSSFSTIACIVGTYEIFTRANEYWKKAGKNELFHVSTAGVSKKTEYNNGLVTIKSETNIADQYVKHYDSLNDIGYDTAIVKYKSILEHKDYSLYLFETWLKWRATYQHSNGLSKSSDIPNDEYNRSREEEATIILNYITMHTDDEMAINEFLLFATHDIVRRFGDYPYGNQSTLEFHELFDEQKK